MAALAQFLMALNHAVNTSCTVVTLNVVKLGAPVPPVDPLTVRYGGNCWDAIQFAQFIGGWVIGL